MGHVVTSEAVAEQMREAEQKALDSLARYKFLMFGYWAAAWVKLNRLGGFGHPNPFTEFVDAARNDLGWGLNSRLRPTAPPPKSSTGPISAPASSKACSVRTASRRKAPSSAPGSPK